MRHRVQISKCALDAKSGNTASDYEWHCPILGTWICETHCFETQIESYADTRLAIIDFLGWRIDDIDLLSVCRKCPFGTLDGTPAAAAAERTKLERANEAAK